MYFRIEKGFCTCTLDHGQFGSVDQDHNPVELFVAALKLQSQAQCLFHFCADYYMYTNVVYRCSLHPFPTHIYLVSCIGPILVNPCIRPL